jgi:hypothetical protein
MFEPMVTSLKEEIDMETLVFGIEAFTECLNIVGENCLSEEQLTQVVAVIVTLLGDVSARRNERAGQRTEEDHDEEEEERIEEEAERDDEIVGQIADLVGALARNYKTNFLPLFSQHLLPFAVDALKPEKPASDRQSALCIFDDIMEHCGKAAGSLFQHFLGNAIQYVTDPDPAVRQAAVYGMGVFAEAGGELIAPAIPGILSRLTQIILQPDARGETYASCTENAIAAVGKICIFHSGVVDVGVILPTWLTWLPVVEDKIESKVTYTQLCNFVESNNPHVLGQNYSNIPKIVSIFALILDTDLIDETTQQRVINILKHMRSSLPAETLQKAFSSLPPELQQKLQKYTS